MSTERKQLTKAVEALTSKQDAFIKAVTAMEEFKKEALSSLDTDIQYKKEELEELEKKYNNKLIDGQTEVDQALKKYEYSEAVKILEKHGEVAFDKDEVENLKQQVSDMKTSHEAEIKKLMAIEKDKATKTLESELEKKDLKHAALNAEMKAQIDQRTHEIEMFKETIANLQKDLSAQRELTKDVALASKQAPISQSFGKN